MRIAVLVCLIGFVATTASKADPVVGLNVGVIEVRALQDGSHVGTYPSLGGSLTWQRGDFSLTPQLGVEYDFQHSRGGLVASLTADRSVIPGLLGIDLALVGIHDQDRFHFDTSIFFVGAGAGFSVFVGPLTISPFVNLFRGLNTQDWSLVPGLNIGFAL